MKITYQLLKPSGLIQYCCSLLMMMLLYSCGGNSSNNEASSLSEKSDTPNSILMPRNLALAEGDVLNAYVSIDGGPQQKMEIQDQKAFIEIQNLSNELHTVEITIEQDSLRFGQGIILAKALKQQRFIEGATNLLIVESDYDFSFDNDEDQCTNITELRKGTNPFTADVENDCLGDFLVTVNFPPENSISVSDTLNVRGTTAAEFRDFKSLQVNGVEAVTQDRFKNWTVTLPLNTGVNNFLVTAVDADNRVYADLEAFTVTKESEAVEENTSLATRVGVQARYFTKDSHIQIDQKNDRIFLLDPRSGAPQFFSVGLESGRVEHVLASDQITRIVPFNLDHENGFLISPDADTAFFLTYQVAEGFTSDDSEPLYQLDLVSVDMLTGAKKSIFSQVAKEDSSSDSNRDHLFTSLKGAFYDAKRSGIVVNRNYYSNSSLEVLEPLASFQNGNGFSPAFFGFNIHTGKAYDLYEGTGLPLDLGGLYGSSFGETENELIVNNVYEANTASYFRVNLTSGLQEDLLTLTEDDPHILIDSTPFSRSRFVYHKADSSLVILNNGSLTTLNTKTGVSKLMMDDFPTAVEENLAVDQTNGTAIVMGDNAVYVVDLIEGTGQGSWVYLSKDIQIVIFPLVQETPSNS